MIKPANSKFAQWCRRYVSFSLVAVAGILVYILFFTDNSVQTTYGYEQEIEQLKAEIKIEEDSLNYYRHLNSSLASDPVTIEQVARENYHMQRENEDIYIIK